MAISSIHPVTNVSQAAAVFRIDSSYQKPGKNSSIGSISEIVEIENKNQLKQAMEEATDPQSFKNKLAKHTVDSVSHKIAEIVKKDFESFSKSLSGSASGSSQPSKLREHLKGLTEIIKGQRLDARI